MRFPEFTDEWKTVTINDICHIIKGQGISKSDLSDTGEPCILYGELYTKYKSEIIGKVLSKTNVNSSKLIRSKENDVIIPSSGETALDIATARYVPFEDILLGGDLNILRLNKGINGAFISYQINGIRRKDVAKSAQGVSVVHLYPEHIKKIKIKLPSPDEQAKITHLLSRLDKRIELQNKIIRDYTSLIKTILIYIFNPTSTKRWSERKLIEVCDRITLRNTNLESTLVLTIASQYGLVSQKEYFNKTVASTDLSNYFLLNKGDFAFNKSYSSDYSLGAIKRLELYPKGVLSPLYICFRPKEEFLDSDFLVFLFESKSWYKEVAEICVEGARNHGLLNVSVVDFFNIKLKIPSLSEQKKISKMLKIIQSKLLQSQKILSLYESQKEYLLKQMFI